jgi:hypothetical protein
MAFSSDVFKFINNSAGYQMINVSNVQIVNLGVSLTLNKSCSAFAEAGICIKLNGDDESGV